MTTLNNATELAGRILLAAIFLIAGISKITGFAGTQAYMESAGVPGALLPLVIALEAGGALAIMVGYRTRLVAALLAGFSILTAALFHGNVADPAQQILFLKNLGLAGGFLLLLARGPGPLSLDQRTGRS